MTLGSGDPAIKVGVVDGPVATGHPGFMTANLTTIGPSGECRDVTSAACLHGTFIVGELSASRESPAPGICPRCTVLLRPIFVERNAAGQAMLTATRRELAGAIRDCVKHGARLVNLSVSLSETFAADDALLEQALDEAMSRNVIIVAAAGNDGIVGGSCLVRHPAVIPVAGCDCLGRPLSRSNLGRTIARNGVCAPGAHITSLAANGGVVAWSGTSAAVPFVTGALALLWSQVPRASASQLRGSVTTHRRSARSIVPPLLDAWSGYTSLIKER
jgi:subtilisin family serine protease